MHFIHKNYGQELQLIHPGSHRLLGHLEPQFPTPLRTNIPVTWLLLQLPGDSAFFGLPPPSEHAWSPWGCLPSHLLLFPTVGGGFVRSPLHHCCLLFSRSVWSAFMTMSVTPGEKADWTERQEKQTTVVEWGSAKATRNCSR